MRISTSVSTLPARSIALLLSYTLFISLYAPFAMRQAEAATPASRVASTIVDKTKPATQAGSDNSQEKMTSADVRSTMGSDPESQHGRARPAPAHEAALPKLPNLDEIRKRPYLSPKAPTPVPSKRCSPRLRGCVGRDRAIVENSVVSGLFFGPPRTNVALAANGGVATASSTTPASDGAGNYQPSAAINGERLALGTGDAYSDNTFWRDGTHDAFPDWLQVEFAGTKTISEIDVYSLQDDYHNPVEPTLSTTFGLYGMTAFDVQYWTGSAWETVTGGSVSGNNKVWRQFTFAPVTTGKIRVFVNNALASRSRIVELEAYEYGAGRDAGSTQSLRAEVATARLDPVNRTGTGGEDLLSGNYNWTLPLVSLPGRAGLDLGLALSYNSLVWTHTGQTITYDADEGFPSPGFRLGFPTIERTFLNSQTGRNAYLLVTPAGGRVELRQSATQPNLYESEDSSYLQLDGSQMILRTGDGTQFSYTFKHEAYRCKEIKDRNGNFITVSYEETGDIKEIIDTLGRRIKFNYVLGNLDTITEQSGTPESQTVLASFGYLPYDLAIQPNFVNESGAPLTIAGVQNNPPLPFLNMVGLPDGSYYKFTYTSWGQVSRITRYGSDSNRELDNHALSYVNYNLPNDTTARTDCPRFTERRNWAENWYGNAEAVTTFAPALNGFEGTMTLPTVTYTTPTGIPSTSLTVLNKETFGTGVQRGLTTKVETFANNSPVRTSETIWTQDKKPDGSEFGYQVNPRPAEAKVSDSSGNVRGTIIDYGQYAAYGLPFEVSEYVGAGKTVLRRTRTLYNLSNAYTARHILGLLSVRLVYDGSSATPVSHDEYLYDLNLNQEYLQDQGAAIQHDRDNYPLSFIEGRGNLTRIVHWNVLHEQAPYLESRRGYNTTGSVIFARDPLGHQTTFGYADSFSTAVNLALPTFAYPTSVTDADGKTSSTRHDYYLGAVAETTDPKGLVVKTLYDSAGRIDRIFNTFDNAFKQFHYGPNYVVTYTSVRNLTDTLYAVTTFDGLGQVTGTAQQTTPPGGPNPHYSGKRLVYDVMGRVEFESNPTEMVGGWVAAGDDLLQADGEGGWRYTQQTYDWKGRPLVTINQDSSTSVASYGGCGCAGGEVITIQGEQVAAGQRRTQKVYHDGLGRPVKTENYNWDATTVYSARTTEYNARDQVTAVKEYQGQATPDGSCPTGTCQQTSNTYDGYGRLATRKLPQQATPTTYTYYADDLVESITDARGATSTYGYNGRHLVMYISHTLAGSANLEVSYGYDEAGNRASMSDANGISEYHYNQLSRMYEEKRTVFGLTHPDNVFKIGYGYDLGGNLTSVTDHFNATVSYARDALGQITAVNGSGFNEVMDTPGGQEVTQYASNFTYRAWGALKHLSYSQGLDLDLAYDKRLQLRQYEVSPVVVVNGNEVKIKNQYDYYADGQVRFIGNLYDHRFDRSYSYDHVGRLSEAHTSHAARGEQGGTLGPYQQSYQYDAFDHMIGRNSKHWSKTFSYSTSYLNNRDQRYGLFYDNEGNLLVDSSGKNHVYDAAGDKVTVADGSGMTVTQGYDGDHLQVKRMETITDPASTSVTYSLRSTVLGGAVLTELYSDGTKWKTKVYADGQLIATQSIGKETNGYGLITQSVSIHHEEPITGNERDSWKQFGTVGEPTQLDPLGVDAWSRNKYLDVEEPDTDWPQRMHGSIDDPWGGCMADGLPMPCSMLSEMLQSPFGRRVRYEPPDVHAPGRSGLRGRFIPRTLNGTPFFNEEAYRLTFVENDRTLQHARRRRQQNTPKPKPHQVMSPIGGVDKLKDLLETKVSEDCNAAIARVIEKIAEITRIKPSATDVMKLFNMMTSQTGGGGIYLDFNKVELNSHIPAAAIRKGEIPGGSGLSWVFGSRKDPQRITTIFLKGAYSDSQQLAFDRLPYDYVVTAIHELIHDAPGNNILTYEHPEMDAAAKALEAPDIDTYIKWNCIPPQYW